MRRRASRLPEQASRTEGRMDGEWVRASPSIAGKPRTTVVRRLECRREYTTAGTADSGSRRSCRPFVDAKGVPTLLRVGVILQDAHRAVELLDNNHASHLVGEGQGGK